LVNARPLNALESQLISKLQLS